MSTAKRLSITIIVSIVLIGIISFLMHVIYVYGFYNKNEINKMTYNFNNNDFDYVYYNLTKKLDKNIFDRIVSIMYDKSTLKDIYYLYYSRSEYSITDFYNEFYFGNKNISSNDISFNFKGKTNLFNKAYITYNYVNVSNKSGNKSSIGIINNISLNVDNNSVLFIDNQKIECKNNKCVFQEIYGGIHEIKYINNNITYYGLLNIVNSDSEINISSLKSLVRINEKTELKSVKDVSLSTIKAGIYNISACYLKEGCGKKKISYLYIFPDNSVELYLYNSFEAAGNYYYGVWKIDGNNIILKFDKHTYAVFDYDSNETTNIDASISLVEKYRIIDETTIRNDKYKFYYVNDFPEDKEIEEE